MDMNVLKVESPPPQFKWILRRVTDTHCGMQAHCQYSYIIW